MPLVVTIPWNKTNCRDYAAPKSQFRMKILREKTGIVTTIIFVVISA